jgi:hypothetical protein
MEWQEPPSNNPELLCNRLWLNNSKGIDNLEDLSVDGRKCYNLS